MQYKINESDFNELITLGRKKISNKNLVIVLNSVSQTIKRNTNHPDTDFFSNEEINELKEGLEEENIGYKILHSEIAFLNEILSKSINSNNSIVWNLTRQGGNGNKKSLVTSMADFYKIPYLGSSVEVMNICRDKQKFEQLLIPLGVNIPTYSRTNLAQYDGLQKIIFKNSNGSASIGLTSDRIKTLSAKQVNDHLRKDKGLIAERFISGYEIEVPMLKLTGSSGPQFKSLSPVGINFGNTYFMSEEILDEQKSSDYDYHFYDLRAFLASDGILDADLITFTLMNIACKIGDLLGISNYARIDFRIDSIGNLHCFDIATTPYLTHHSSPIWQSNRSKHTQGEFFLALIGSSD